MSHEIKLVPTADCKTLKDVFLDGGLIGRVGKQMDRASDRAPRYFWQQAGAPDSETASQRDYTQEHWAAEALVRTHPGMASYQDWDPATGLAEMEAGGNVVHLNEKGHPCAVTMRNGQEFCIRYRLEAKREIEE